MLIEVPDDIAARLQKMAEKRGCTIGEILRPWTEPEPEEQYGTLADMLRNADEANLGRFRDGPTDTSARSREILNAEFADYIRRKQQE